MSARIFPHIAVLAKGPLAVLTSSVTAINAFPRLTCYLQYRTQTISWGNAVNTLRIALLAISVSALAFNAVHARQGGTTGGYYVTTCKTIEGTSRQKPVCVFPKGCYTVYLPVKKTTTCTQKWVNPNAI
jgi:hypothetical protein